MTHVERSRGDNLAVFPQIDGGVALVVLGSPPDGSGPEAVAAGMRMPTRQGGRPFVAIEPDLRQDRFVVSFGPAAPQALCEHRATGASGQGGLHMSFAYCRGDRSSASAQMTNATVTGPSHEGFRRATSTALNAMLMRRHPGGRR